MYNPVTNVVHEKEKIEKLDKSEKNKKKRFEIKYDVENYYRNKSIAVDLQKEMHKHPVLSYERYKHQDVRGYDIISLDNRNAQNLNDVRIKDQETSWQKIVRNVDGNLFLFNFLIIFNFLEKNKNNFDGNIYVSPNKKDPMIDYFENKNKNESKFIRI